MDQSDNKSHVSIVRFAHPPVNAMVPGVPDMIIDRITAAQQEGAGAILLVPGGTGVLSGADVSMQGNTWPMNKRRMSELIELLDAFPVPVGILLRRSALGGGLEIAMACRWRIAVLGTMLGQPEVNLGIPPGAGGTQRLPRLVGVKTALDMIVSGAPIAVREALDIKLVDHIADPENAEEEAVHFLQKELAAGRIPDPVSTGDIKHARTEVFDAARAQAARRRRGEDAPLAAIDAMQGGLTLSFADGIKHERALYERCVNAPQAAAMRHVFFAKRSALKGHVPAETRAHDVRQVGVIGAGTMGVGIALCFLLSGYRVHLCEQQAPALEAGLGRIASELDKRMQKGRLSAAKVAEITSSLTSGLDMKALSICDLVIEAAFEDIDVKRTIFRSLAEVTSPGTVLATNTSYLDLDRIAAAAGNRAADVIGMHFFSPAHIMPLLEIVRGQQTSKVALTTALKFSKTLEKTGIVSGVCHGFIANRTFEKYLREAEFLLAEGATPAQVDHALVAFGLPMGPFAVRDLAGLDIGWAKRKATAHLRDPAQRYSRIGDLICENGWFGQKTGRGFYRYPDGACKGVEDPEINDLILAEAERSDITQRTVTDDEIIDRCLLAVVNEGAKLLDEGIARTSADIDLAWIEGYGFPCWRGGPMYWAGERGLSKVLSAIRAFDAQHDFWQPATLLEELADAGGTFQDHTRTAA